MANRVIESIGSLFGADNGAKTSEFHNNAGLDKYNSDLYNGTGQAGIDQKYAGSNTGSDLATGAVQHNGIMGQLFGQDGALGSALGKEQELQNQGFQLKPEDVTQYGQTSGNIARMFGQSGNQMSQNLASRGLASAPSGAAGAMFSGLQGSQNEMLAHAQQQIMQQRFQNTQNQIAQQQKFATDLGQQGANAVNQQYGRQLEGAKNYTGNVLGASQQTINQNKQATEAVQSKDAADAANQPMNIGDYLSAGIGKTVQRAGDFGGAGERAAKMAGPMMGGG